MTQRLKTLTSRISTAMADATKDLGPSLEEQIKASKAIPHVLPMTKVQVASGDPFNGKPIMVAIGEARVQQDPWMGNLRVGMHVKLQGDRREALCEIKQKLLDTDTNTLIFNMDKIKISERQVASATLDLSFNRNPDGTMEFDKQEIKFTDEETDDVDIESDLI